MSAPLPTIGDSAAGPAAPLSPQLLVLRSLWTNGFDLPSALADVAGGPYDGVEGPLPSEASARREFLARLRGSGLPFVAEIATGGGYVPKHADAARHLDEFRLAVERAREAGPLFVTALAGCDCWPLGQSADFLSQAIEFAGSLGVVASFETHRSRPAFHPWAAGELLRRVPALLLTCDFSHWCCVCERLVLDEDGDLLRRLAGRAHHIHGRVGYEQGPQVPHPADPAYASALAAHERWWDAIWDAQAAAGRTQTTLTPEFGPDGYLQSAPFSRAPAADLAEINRWMARRQAARFARRRPTVEPGSAPLR